jgi:hypothetical protein
MVESKKAVPNSIFTLVPERITTVLLKDNVETLESNLGPVGPR